MEGTSDEMTQGEAIFQYRGLAYAPSWACNSRCEHCFIPSSFRRRDDYDERVARSVICDSPSTIVVIAFTGGEPFLFPQRLLHLFRLARKNGKTSTVVTNGFWMSNKKTSEDLLCEAYDHGLRALSLSIDRYHFPYPDPSSVVRSLEFARRQGIAINVRSAGRPRNEMYRAIRASGVLVDQGNPQSLFDLENVGEARLLPPDRIEKAVLSECLSALQPIITPEGRFIACCQAHAFEINNPLLNRGNVLKKHISSIIASAQEDYLLASLVVNGPAGFLKYLPQIGHKRDGSRCDLCLQITNRKGLLDGLRRRLSKEREWKKEVVGRYLVYEKCHRPDFLPELFKGIPSPYRQF